MDYDEVLFYHKGDFFSRDGIHPGVMSFHPAGFPHGPHPKAIQNVKTKTRTNECAIMVDSREALKIESAFSIWKILLTGSPGNLKFIIKLEVA